MGLKIDLAKRNAMAKVEVTIPDRIDVKIARLIEDGEFVDREEAVRELLSAGVKTYQTTGGTDEPGFEDPGEMPGGYDDEYVF